MGYCNAIQVIIILSICLRKILNTISITFERYYHALFIKEKCHNGPRKWASKKVLVNLPSILGLVVLDLHVRREQEGSLPHGVVDPEGRQEGVIIFDTLSLELAGHLNHDAG